MKLKAFSQFENTTEALAAATTIVDSKLGKGLKKFLKKHAVGDTLAVADAKLGSLIKEKLEIPCIHSQGVQEMMRGVRSQVGRVPDRPPLPASRQPEDSTAKMSWTSPAAGASLSPAAGCDYCAHELLRRWLGWSRGWQGMI